MFARLLFIILLFAKTVAFAAVPCDVLLQAAEKTTADIQHLSNSARVYINLIKLYIGQKGVQFDASIAYRILNSEKFVNPFNGIGSFDNQISTAINKIQPQIDPADWQQIKIEIYKLVKSSASEAEDRAKKETDTSYLFDPHLVDTKPDRILDNLNAVWYAENGETYLAVNHDFNKLVDGEPKRITSVCGYPTPNTNPSFNSVNGRLLLAYLSTYSDNTHYIGINEVTERGLTAYTCKKIPIQSNQGVVWHNIGNRTFLSITSHHLYFFELIGTEIRELGVVDVGATRATSASWQIIGDRVFIAVGSRSGDVKLYEKTKDDKIVLIDEHKISKDMISEPVWKVIDGRYFIAASATSGELLFYEFINNKLTVIDWLKTDLDFEQGPFWIEEFDQIFLVKPSYKKLDFYELYDERLKLVASLPLKQDFYTAGVLDRPGLINKQIRIEEKSGDGAIIELFKRVKKQ